MSKGSKWRKTDFKQYWDNWPKSMSCKKQQIELGVVPMGYAYKACPLTAEEAAAKILKMAKTRPGFFIV